MVAHIGIVGCSAEGASLCYRTLCLEGGSRPGGFDHPEVSMHTHPYADYDTCVERGDWEGVAALMSSSAAKLARAGAELLICPDNTIHLAMPFVERSSTLPWIHIVDVVVQEASRRRFRRLGLTGTRWLVQSDLYPGKLAARDIACVLPDPTEREATHRIIMEELVLGVHRPEAVRYFQGLFERMKAAGCDAVVLGCTEIPMIMSDANSPLPTLDSTRLLARAALSRVSR
jgi:aspartate racemase